MTSNAQIQVQFQMVENHQQVHFIGKLIYGHTQLAKDALKANLQKTNGYMLNMTKLEMIDSTGFGVMINLAKQVREYGAKLVIIVSDPAIKEYFHMAKFHLLFPIVDNEAKAVDILKDARSFEGLVADY